MFEPASRPDARYRSPIVLLARLQLVVRGLGRRQVFALFGAVVVGLVVYSTVNGAQRRAELLGQTERVAVASERLVAGTVLQASHFDLVERPTGFVPVNASRDLTLGDVVVAEIAQGEVIVADRLTAGNGLFVHERSVTIPLTLSTPLLTSGAIVELVGLTIDESTFGQQISSPTVRVICSGRAMAVTESSAAIAVPEGCALDAIRLAASGAVEIIVTPWTTIPG